MGPALIAFVFAGIVIFSATVFLLVLKTPYVSIYCLSPFTYKTFVFAWFVNEAPSKFTFPETCNVYEGSTLLIPTLEIL